MKITVIADNYVDKPCLTAEHGFSCLIETSDKKILFDTGQGGALLKNMHSLNIAKDIDMIVLSHGHYDHTGGLAMYMDELAEYSADIYASRFIFEKHLKKTDSGFDYIGFPSDMNTVESKYKIHFNEALTEISGNIYLSGPVKRFVFFDSDKLLYTEIDGEYEKDYFRDEQYLVVKEENGIHIVTGCTHSGAVNLLLDAKEKFKGEKVLSLTGGLHLFRSDNAEVEQTVRFLSKEHMKIYTGHCTGLDAFYQMKQSMSGVEMTKAGLSFEL